MEDLRASYHAEGNDYSSYIASIKFIEVVESDDAKPSLPGIRYERK